MPHIEGVSQERIQVGDITLNVATAGPPDGPLVILLHGFPEFWYGWRHQIPYLAKLGFRVIAPDQRGYNLSDKPKGVASYGIDILAADIAGLIEATGHSSAQIVGHDWGAAVGWWMALKQPERCSRFVALNVPHPMVFQKTLLTSLSQMRKSWYMFFFQVPWLPESIATRNNFESGATMLQKASRPGSFTDEELEHYREAWSQPGAVKGMLGWYRALVRYPGRVKRRRLKVPTLLIWGCDDIALDRRMAAPSVELCNEGRLELFEDATHFVQHDEPDRVNALLGEFLELSPSEPAAS